MINAIILVFLGMTMAEQSVIAGYACAVDHQANIADWRVTPSGLLYTFTDESQLLYADDGSVKVGSGPREETVK